MSVLTFEISSPSIVSRLPELLRQLWVTKASQVRNYNELKALPDHLLLDIGVDPRDVPFNVAGEIARPDLAHSGPATATFRTIAKS
jgi:uncharacterized protein YjiS (DUF1127 family)